MKIGIDISQIAHEGTGVAQYVRSMVTELIRKDTHNEYVLFGASLRKQSVFHVFFSAIQTSNHNVRLVVVPIPPTILAMLWNRFHWIPIEWFIGGVDVFWSSDWTQPPLRAARGITTIHDLSVLKYPLESHQKQEIQLSSLRLIANIVTTQKLRLKWAVKECSIFLCDSYATQSDAMQLLHLSKEQLPVVYPGFTSSHYYRAL